MYLHTPYTVPTYNGRNPFHLTHFKSLPCIKNEIQTNSAALIVFSLGGYNLADSGAMNIGITMGISNKVQSVILLADPHLYILDPSDDFISSNSSLHLGVLTEIESSDSGKEDNDDSNDQYSGPLM
jgi:hypothetical protein